MNENWERTIPNSKWKICLRIGDEENGINGNCFREELQTKMDR